MSKKILVLGWYNHNNLGDDLFEDAFKFLFPEIDFIFVNRITIKSLENIDTVFIGGGSLLGEPLSISPDANELLKLKNIFYIGVGSETNFHETHIPYMQLAKLIATRTNINYDNLLKLNSNILIIPDLVHCLPITLNSNRETNSILVIPNILVTPKWNDPYWKHAAWNSFKVEFAQTLDHLSLNNKIHFFPMCVNDIQNDQYAAIEIINSMSKKNVTLLNPKNKLSDITQLFSQYSLILSQRYHGAILARMSQTPHLTIHHHDKLKNVDGETISYYGLYKDLLLEKINLVNNSKLLPIDRNIFNNLKKYVLKFL